MDNYGGSNILQNIANMKRNQIIVIIATATCIGILTSHFVKSLMDDFIVPFFNLIAKYNIITIYITKYTSNNNTIVSSSISIILDLLVKLLYWSITFYIVYLLFKYIGKLDSIANNIALGEKILMNTPIVNQYYMKNKEENKPQYPQNPQSPQYPQ